jgi:hypothetical protein
MAREYKLTHDRLLEVLDYDPATGIFVWKVARSNRVKIGSRAGVHHIPSGGRYISIDNEKFMAHRLAFFYVNRRWPNTDVRPLDGDYDNSAINNLKEVQRVELAHQRTKQSNNTSGFLGVSKTVGGKWQASLTWNYQQFSLGANYESPEAANEAREEAVRRFTGTSTQSEYERVLEELRVWKGQRTAWRFLNRNHSSHAWASFEGFCRDVIDVPVMRYAMVPLDATLPIGPQNYRWAYPEGLNRRAPENLIYRRANRHHERNKELQKNFGINAADYQRLLDEQGGVCAICGQPETKPRNSDERELSVDHDHHREDKRIRGLLCGNCNDGLGKFGDRDPAILHSAGGYLEKYYARYGETRYVTPTPFDLSVTAAMAVSPHRDWLSVATLGFGA